jgi:probable rRNA maturation factor
VKQAKKFVSSKAVNVNICIFNSQQDLSISKRQVKNIVREVITFEGDKCDEVAVHFVKVRRICRLHEQFFQDSSPTDCISFPIDDNEEEGYRVLGEVFVCPQTAIEYAKKHKKDPYIETTLYIVHGLLHLMGYEDVDKIKRRRMRSAERRHMENLQKSQIVLCMPSKTSTSPTRLL